MDNLAIYLANLKEGLNVEMKESSNKVPDSFYETYSSFSNTNGGTIYLGIKEGKTNTIIGVKNPFEQKKNLIAALHSKEKISYCSLKEDDIQILDVLDKKILKINVREAPKEVQPVYIKGNLSLSYERIGDGDYLLSEDDISSRLLIKRGIHFDALPNIYDFDDSRIDQNTLKQYRQYLDSISPNNIFSRLNNHDFLSRIGAITNANGKEVLTNGAVLFLGFITDIMQLVPNFFLDYQENITSNSRWDYRLTSDDLSKNCNLYNFFLIISKRMVENLPNPFKSNGISNIDGEDLRRAVIEGLSNAISNQNYLSLPGISIKKTQNYIKITNSGDMPVSIEQAKKGGISEPRNVNIMNYLRIIQVADRGGTGIPTIYDVFKSYRFPAPLLAVEKNPTRTELTLNFSLLFSNTPYREEKQMILSFLDSHEEGATISELALLINKKNTVTTQILNELLSLNYVQTNGKKTKGRRFYKLR